MSTASNLDFFIRIVDLAVIVTAIWMLSYALYRGYFRSRQTLPTGSVLVAFGLIVIAVAHLSDFAFQFQQPSDTANSIGLTSTRYWSGWYDWLMSRTAFVLILTGLAAMVINRRRTEKNLSTSMAELDETRLVGIEADERFDHALNSTSNSMYCYAFDPPMSIDLPIEEQIERSLDATLLHCNTAYARQFGAAQKEDLIGQSLRALDRSESATAHAAYFKAFVDNGYQFVEHDLHYETADGRDKAIRMNVSGVIVGHGLERLWAVETNILDLHLTREALERRQTFLEMIAWVSSELVTVQNETADDMVERCMSEICRYLEADRSSIYWRDGDNKSASILYAWGSPGDPRGRTVALDSLPGISMRLGTGGPVQIDDVSAMPDEFESDRQELERFSVKSLIILPMSIDREIVGGMTISRFERAVPWASDDLQDAIVFSDLLANFIMRLKSHRALNDALAGLKRATDRLEAENLYLREEVSPKHDFEEIVGQSNEILRSLRLVEQVAQTSAPVLILGETGTGKELIARAIHDRSERGDRPLVKVNCAALPANLIESELFGHEKGAFTGADSSKRGRFDLAHGSTLFLDEFGEIPVEMQSKLLRVLQEGEFERLGGVKTVTVNVRILVATNRDLKTAVMDGQFRSDLFYRINTFPIELPALRDRIEDIDLLAEHFVNSHAKRLDREVQEISAEMMRQLRSYSWPGNVRELDGIIQRALISTSGPILELAEPLVDSSFSDGTPRIISSSIADLKLVERDHILGVLEDTSWKISGKTGAASRLGIPPSTLRSKMKKLSITRPH